MTNQSITKNKTHENAINYFDPVYFDGTLADDSFQYNKYNEAMSRTLKLFMRRRPYLPYDCRQ